MFRLEAVFVREGHDSMNIQDQLCLSVVAWIAFSAMVAAETSAYGSFRHESDLPHVLFLTGEIQNNDSFELRRAMRDQTISLVVTASPGGSLYEGLQIAAILHDNEIATYVPVGASCESSCANIFLGGFRRLLIGDLGVHQFYSGGPDASASTPKDLTTAATQYTTADIIGIMNQFETPPFVYEKMLGTTEIYYFAESEKPRLNKRVDDADFVAKLLEVDAYLARKPELLERTLASPAETSVAESPPAGDPATAPGSPAMEYEALALVIAINRDWSMTNEHALPAISRYYSDSVEFYGKAISRDEVMLEKENFAVRWPVRKYNVEEGSVSVDCSTEGCVLDSVIAWSAASPERGSKASGRSTWNLVLVAVNGELRIVGETGTTLNRN